MGIVNHTFKKQTTKRCHFKSLLDILLQEQLHQILNKMFKISFTICWKIRN